MRLLYSSTAHDQLLALAQNKGREQEYKAVIKALKLLADDPRHPGLNNHKYDSLQGPGQKTVFEAYAQNNSPSAYRVFFYCSAEAGAITVLSVLPHP